MPPEDPEDAGSPRASSPEVVGQVMDQILEEVLRREGAAEVMDSTATTVAVEEDFDDCPLRLKRVRAPSKKKAEADEAEEMLRRALQGEKDEDVVVVPHCRDCKRDLEGPEALRVPPPKRCRDCRRKRKIAFTPRNKVTRILSTKNANVCSSVFPFSVNFGSALSLACVGGCRGTWRGRPKTGGWCSTEGPPTGTLGGCSWRRKRQRRTGREG